MLHINHLSVDYFRRGKTMNAVRNVSLHVSAGETVGLVGESGSGKSTIALSILRLIGPHEGRITAGEIQFQGQNLLTWADPAMQEVRRHSIRMVFQDPFTSLNPVMRIREQMMESQSQSQIEDLAVVLQKVQLDPKRILGSYPHQLSGGQRQRVLIAMAILPRPKLLLADEPTTALDVLVQKDILELLFTLQKEMGMAMLFISHNLGLVAQYTQRMAVMKEGQVVETGPSRSLFQAPQHPYTQELFNALPAMVRGA